MGTVIHLLPYDGIGGAEEAARSMARGPTGDFEFRLRFLFPEVTTRRQRGRTFNPVAALSTVRGLVRERPDILVLSLWRSCLAGILVKILAPRTRLVVMIHNSVDAHVADYLSTRLAMAFAEAVWTDSHASMAHRFRSAPKAPVTVIPFLTRRLEPAIPVDASATPTPAFIFWGRLAAQKNLRQALRLFQQIHRSRPEATFTIIGPDSGEQAALMEWCTEAGLSMAVRFAGPMDIDGIRAEARESSFYLQTSDYEGMAMSVVEAMQLGLVPVVTPVGEIGRYCRHHANAVLVDDTGQAAIDVLRLLDDPAAWRALRGAALEAWRGHPLYRDAVSAECRRLLESHRSQD